MLDEDKWRISRRLMKKKMKPRWRGEEKNSHQVKEFSRFANTPKNKTNNIVTNQPYWKWFKEQEDFETSLIKLKIRNMCLIFFQKNICILKTFHQEHLYGFVIFYTANRFEAVIKLIVQVRIDILELCIWRAMVKFIKIKIVLDIKIIITINIESMKAGLREKKVEGEKVSAWTWKEIDSCIIGESSGHSSEKIAGFDMDSTLIITKSGAKFAKNAQDWVYWDERVPTKLKELVADGYKIVIFTNQKGISTGQTRAADIKKKIQDIAKDIQIQIQAVIATKDDQYRKPNVKMWETFVANNGGVQPDKSKSFYCGDAAGRKDGKHKDFSDGDLKFALNVGLEFKTPENLFQGDEKKIVVQGFNPANIPQTGNLFANSTDQDVTFVEKEMVIFTGSPGAGKSTFWLNYMPKYERVNRDTLKTKEKCYKVAEQHILKGKSVVIDNTNPKKEDRKYFVDLAKKHGYKVRSFIFLTPKEICTHNDGQRVSNQVRKHFSGKAGKIAIATYWKYLEKPTTQEGFYQVKQVNFIGKFNDQADKQAYLKF